MVSDASSDRYFSAASKSGPSSLLDHLSFGLLIGSGPGGALRPSLFAASRNVHPARPAVKRLMRPQAGFLRA
jgi:hypothetical protein